MLSPPLLAILRAYWRLRDNHLTHRVFAATAQIIDACCQAGDDLLAETGRLRSLCSYPWLEKVSA